MHVVAHGYSLFNFIKANFRGSELPRSSGFAASGGSRIAVEASELPGIDAEWAPELAQIIHFSTSSWRRLAPLSHTRARILSVASQPSRLKGANHHGAEGEG